MRWNEPSSIMQNTSQSVSHYLCSWTWRVSRGFCVCACALLSWRYTHSRGKSIRAMCVADGPKTTSFPHPISILSLYSGQGSHTQQKTNTRYGSYVGMCSLQFRRDYSNSPRDFARMRFKDNHTHLHNIPFTHGISFCLLPPPRVQPNLIQSQCKHTHTRRENGGIFVQRRIPSVRNVWLQMRVCAKESERGGWVYQCNENH